MARKDEEEDKNAIVKMAEVGDSITIQTLMESGAIPATFNTPEKIMTVIKLGKELGIPEVTALNNINLIHGKVVISSTILLSLLEQHGIEYRWTKDYETEESGKIVTEIEFTSLSKITGGERKQTFSTSWQELSLAGLTDGPMYKKYPKVMQRARCAAFAIRACFPKILLGMHTDEEILGGKADGVVDEAGNIKFNPEEVDETSFEIVEEIGTIKTEE